MQKEHSALIIRTKINKIQIHAKLFAQKSSTHLLFHLFSLLIYDFLRVWLILIKPTRLETIFSNPHSELLRFYARLFQYFFDSALWLCLLKQLSENLLCASGHVLNSLVCLLCSACRRSPHLFC